MEVQRLSEPPQAGPSVRWHPALLQQDEHSSLHSQARPGPAAWPGRIVGVHRMQPHATTGPFADARRAPPDSADSESAWGAAASTSGRFHAGAEPQRCYSAPVPSAEDIIRPHAHHASTCSRGGESLHQLYWDPKAVASMHAEMSLTWPVVKNGRLLVSKPSLMRRSALLL